MLIGSGKLAIGECTRPEVQIMDVKDLIAKAVALPVEDRALLADAVLRSLNPPEAQRDRKWVEVAQRRLAELRSGQRQGVPGDEVFAKVQRRLSR
jgi:hypothetical protein